MGLYLDVPLYGERSLRLEGAELVAVLNDAALLLDNTGERGLCAALNAALCRAALALGTGLNSSRFYSEFDRSALVHLFGPAGYEALTAEGAFTAEGPDGETDPFPYDPFPYWHFPGRAGVEARLTWLAFVIAAVEAE